MNAIFMTTIITIFLLFSTTTHAKTFGSSLCKKEGFTCYTVKRGDNWQKLFPDEDKRDLIMRINRMNTRLYPGLKIAIPDQEHLDDLDPLYFSPLPNQIDSKGKKTIIVSIQHLAFGAYDADGTLTYWGPISAAKGYCPDVKRRCTTVLGKFAIYRKLGAQCVSSKYPVGKGGAPMPYCMFFHGGYALHGSYNVPGYNDSHGCVRLFVKDAKWLNQEFTPGGTTRILVTQ